MRKIKVYIAGPYTKKDPCENTNKAILIASKLIELGYIPFIPHLCHFWHTTTPKPYEFWTSYDLEWLDVCNCLLRFEGESKGADNEVEVAKKMNIPVFYSVDELVEYYKDKKK